MATITIVRVPSLDPSDKRLPALADKLRAKRLQALLTDPESYLTRYEEELKKPPAFTQNLLLDHKATHFFGIRAPGIYNPDDDILSFILANDLVAFVILADSSYGDQPKVDGSPTAPPTGSVEPCKYILSAVWVDESLRGQGLGRRLIQHVISYMREVEGKSSGRPRCETGARHGNLRALSLYQSLGFEIVDSDDLVERNGRSFRRWALQLQL